MSENEFAPIREEQPPHQRLWLQRMIELESASSLFSMTPLPTPELRAKLRDYEAALKDARAENTALRKVIAEAASLNNSDDNGARRVAARILGEALLGGQPT